MSAALEHLAIAQRIALAEHEQIIADLRAILEEHKREAARLIDQRQTALAHACALRAALHPIVDALPDEARFSVAVPLGRIFDLLDKPAPRVAAAGRLALVRSES